MSDGVLSNVKEPKDFRAQHNLLPISDILSRLNKEEPKPLKDLDWFSILLIVVPVIFNAVIIIKAFVNRPDNNSDEYLSWSKIAVAWADLLLLLSTWFIFFLFLCKGWWFRTAGTLKYLGSVSLWKCAVRCSPTNLWRYIKDVKAIHKENNQKCALAMLIIKVVGKVLDGSLGVLSILLKVVSVHFVAEDEGWETSPSQVFIFLGFINQVVGGSQDRSIPWEAGYSKMLSAIEFLYAVGVEAEEHMIEGRKPIEETGSFMAAICSARVENTSKSKMHMLSGFLSLLTMDEAELYGLACQTEAEAELVVQTKNRTVDH